MRSLQELVAFTGVTTTAGERIGKPIRRASMRASGDMVSLLSDADRHSMRALALALQRLPSISLDAEIVGDAFGKAPFLPDIRIQPSGGAVVETVLNYFQGDRNVTVFDNGGLADGAEVLPDGRIRFPLQFGDPGPYVAVVTRIGITSDGVTALTKRLPFSVASPPPPPPPPPPPQQSVTCGVELDLDQPGFGGIEGVRVFGAGFVAGEGIDVLEGKDVAATTAADALGMYKVHIGLTKSRLPVQHVFHTRGQGSGRISNDAGYTV